VNIQHALDSLPELHSQLAWWVKIHTELPCCIYYFGPFDTATEAQTDRGGYIEDLQNEFAQGINTTIELLSPPQLLTIDCA
jgi:hypothetical protein